MELLLNRTHLFQSGVSSGMSKHPISDGERVALLFTSTLGIRARRAQVTCAGGTSCLVAVRRTRDLKSRTVAGIAGTCSDVM